VTLAVFSPHGPSARELIKQALSSVERGYDLLAPKFDHTPFRTPDAVLDATAGALRPLGPFGRGLDVCCGTGAGLRVLSSACRGPITGVDFSTGMLAQARRAHPDASWVRADVRALPFAGAFDLAVSFGALGHFLPAERPALFAGVYRALRPCSGSTWRCGSAMPCGAPRLSCTTAPARGPRRPDRIRIHCDGSSVDGSGPRRGRQPTVPACPRAHSRRALTAAYASSRLSRAVP
jgi:SAM-dependent methyltransferase